MVLGKLIRPAPGRPHPMEALNPRGRTLDLWQTSRERRQSKIFYAFENLVLGEFLLVNDHDPESASVAPAETVMAVCSH